VRISDSLTFAAPWRVLAALSLAALVAGCTTTRDSSDESIAMTILYGGRPPPPAQPDKREIGCPYTEVLEGTVAYRAGGDSARGVNYQSSLTNIARECSDDGRTMRIKVGVEGRLILGEGGRPGGYTAPVRIAVRKGQQVVYSKLHTIPVSVPANDTHGRFQVIDEGIVLPIGADDPADEYKIVIGLDPQGQRGPRNRRR
jgi:hypothetical protein